ncbi:MAG: hypothetical protein Q8M38_01400, partial [Phenylobacterium sp.]|nr:hypothetical protein [Phenylobacterium sp.]
SARNDAKIISASAASAKKRPAKIAFFSFGSRSVFSLVILAWSTLACAFGPLMIVQALGRRLTQPQAIVLMLGGVAIAFAWRMQGWHEQVYEGLPGMLIPTIIGLAISHRAPARGVAEDVPASGTAPSQV